MNEIPPKRRKLVFFLLIVVLFLGAFYFLLPPLFGLPPVQKKLSAFVSRQVPGTAGYRKAALSLFPGPAIHFYDVALETDRQVSGTIHEISATPHFFSLLRGRFNIAKITFSGVECTAELPGKTGTLSPAMILAELQQRLGTWADMLGPVKQKQFVLDIESAELTLTQGQKPLFSLEDIAGNINWQRPVVALDVTSKTALWDPGRLMLEMNTETREVSGRLTANNFNTAPAADFAFAGTPLCLEEVSLDADISWETDDFESWRLSLQASDPALTFRSSDTRFELKGRKAAGQLQFDKTGIHASISHLDLDAPDIRLTGGFDLDTETPRVSWRVTVADLDVASTRTAMLFFAGRFKIARTIAKIFQDGGITAMSMGQEARTPDGLKKVQTFHLKGNLEAATVFVPGAELLLTESFGQIEVSDGRVNATDLETRLGNSTGDEGSFAIALTGGRPWPWSVACDVRADMAQLPPLLERLTPGTAFAREMAGIESATGSATGSLVLDRTADGLQIAVDVSAFDLSADYHRVPFPLTLSGGKFSYRNDAIQLRDIGGSVGENRFSDLDAGLSWDDAPHLSISSARADVDATELARWLGERLPGFRAVDGAPPCTGRLSIDRLQFDGPLDTPGAWQFWTDGTVTQALTICPPLASETVSVYSGKFAATHEKIDALDANVSVMDSTFSLSGALENYLGNGLKGLDVLVMGKLGRTTCDGLMEYARIPQTLQWRAPVNMGPIALRWQENGPLDISGDASFENGLRLFFDLEKTSDGWTYSRWDLSYDREHAAATLTRGADGLGLRFKGHLSQTAMSMLLVENQWFSGALSGDFNAQWSLSPPYLNHMTGHLEAKDVDISPVGLPLEIEQVAIMGSGAAVDIGTGRFVWKGAGIETFGRVSRTGAGLALDLDLAARSLDGANIKALMETTTSPDTAITPYLSGEIRFSCDTLSLTPALAFQPFEALLKLEGEKTDIVFRQADTCGISFPGTLTVAPEYMRFDFKPTATDQDLKPTLGCLKEGNAFMDGSFDLTGDIAFQWDRTGSIWEAMAGSASLTARDGRIYKGALLGKLFSMLNVSEVLSGEFPDFEQEGFPYQTSTFEGTFKNGAFELETGVIDSTAMKIFFEGAEDLMNRQHKLTVVVAPLKTVDAMIDKIPLLNDVLEKGLVVYPVKVTGGWEKPQVSILSPTAVGGEVLGIMLRTLKAPVKLFEKIFTGGKTDTEETPP